MFGDSPERAERWLRAQADRRFCIIYSSDLFNEWGEFVPVADALRLYVPFAWRHPAEIVDQWDDPVRVTRGLLAGRFPLQSDPPPPAYTRDGF